MQTTFQLRGPAASNTPTAGPQEKINWEFPNGCELRRNLDKKGLEILFPEKPPYVILNELKSRKQNVTTKNGEPRVAQVWHWTQKHGVWYADFSESEKNWAIQWLTDLEL